MVELRKRKASPDSAPPREVKKANSIKSSSSSAKKNTGSIPKPAPHAKVAVGDSIDLEDFGGEIETNAGKKTTLKNLVNESKSGVVLFTYPKASTPGCTTQACMFRDEYACLTATGLSIYGLSTDSPKSNTTFKSRQKLPYTLLCDPKATLIAAIGMKKLPNGTIRGVFVVSKEGKVEAVGPGGPAATMEMVRKLVESGEGKMEVAEGDDVPQQTESKASNGDAAEAEVAAEVANSAEKLDAGADL